MPVVLIVEDDPQVRTMLVRELSRDDHVVRSAGTALAG